MKRLFLSIVFLISAPIYAGTLVQRQSTGLLLREDFSAPTGWTNGGNFSATRSPGLVIFANYPFLSPTTSGVDDEGCRESNLFIDGDWTNLTTPRHLFYGSGGVGQPWRPMLATSVDGGKTFTKLGGWGPGLSDGLGGSYASRDMLYLDKRNGVYILHAMSGQGVDGAGIPAPPYQSDIWQATSLTNWTSSAFTYYGPGVVKGATGTFDEYSAYASCVVRDNNGGFLLFYNSMNGDVTLLNTGLSTNTPLGSPFGPFTKTGSPVLPDSSNFGENPKVFFSNALQKYVQLQNRASVAGATDQNVYWLSDKLADWSLATMTQEQRISPIDGQGAVGLMSPYYLPEGRIIETEDGYIPVTWDGWPPNPAGQHVHERRVIVTGVLESSPYALTYTPPASAPLLSDTFNRSDRSIYGDNNWITGGGSTDVTISSNKLNLVNALGERVVVNSSTSMQNGYIQADLTLGQLSGIGFVFRWQNSSNFQWIDFAFDNTQSVGKLRAYIWKAVSGTQTELSHINLPDVTVDSTNTMKVSVSGQVYSIYLNGSLIGTLTGDGSITAAGLCGLRNGGPGTNERLVDNFVVYDASAAAPDTGHTYRKSLAHTNFEAEYSVNFTTLAGSSYSGFDYRIQSGGDSYRALLSPSSGLKLQKSSGGTYSDLASSSGTLVAIANMNHRIRVSVTGNVHNLYLDGELQVTYTDTASPFTSGVSVGFAGKSVSHSIRLFHIRQSGSVVVNGLTAGQVVTLRAPGTVPMATLTASGSSVTFTTTHFPAGSIEIDGVNNPVVGGIWGGDMFAVPAGASAHGFSF